MKSEFKYNAAAGRKLADRANRWLIPAPQGLADTILEEANSAPCHAILGEPNQVACRKLIMMLAQAKREDTQEERAEKRLRSRASSVLSTRPTSE